MSYEDNQPDFSWVDDAPLNASAADVAAYRLSKGVKHEPLPVNDDRYKHFGPENPERPSYMVEPSLLEAQGGMQLPPGIVQDASGALTYKDTGDLVPIARRPGLLPFTATPEGFKFVTPKMLDIVGNVMAPLAAGGVPAKAGEMVLGSGMVKTAPEAAPFKKWFDKSKVVDNEGKPLVVYHGTKSDFNKFDISKARASDEGLVGKGFYFTYNPEEASGYALNEQFGKAGKPNVIPAHVSLQNPMIIKQGILPDGRNITQLHKGGINAKTGDEIRKLAEDTGHDGIMFTNNDGKVGHVVAWHPEQIKSSIGNNGKFDPTNSNILYSDTRNQAASTVSGQLEKGNAQPFYSALERAVSNAKVEKAGADQWLGYLKNQPGVKAEELSTVLKELPEGPITKTQLENLVKVNKVELKEVVKQSNKEYHDRYWETKYHDYQLPGGENYKEMLLQLPNKTDEQFKTAWKAKTGVDISDATPEQINNLRKSPIADVGGDYKSSHWDEPNVLAHVRMNDRTIEGKKVLHLEEIQSDWHQAGRKQGYKLNEGQKKELEGIDEKLMNGLDEKTIGNPDIKSVLKTAVDQKVITAEEASKYESYSKGENSNVPDAPFKKNWDELALKRMMRHASENGYEGLSWTRGENHPTNPKVLNSGSKEQQELADKGLQSFYNETLVNKANALGKKYGAKVEQKELSNPNKDKYYIHHIENIHNKANDVYDIRFKNQQDDERVIRAFNNKEEADKFLNEKNNEKGTSIHYLPITPELRNKAMQEGFPLFSSSVNFTPVSYVPDIDNSKNKKYKLVPIKYNPFE